MVHLHWIKDWLYEDLNMTLRTRDDLNYIKNWIKTGYQGLYPELYIDNNRTDRQGWTRVWLTQKMKEMLDNAHKA